ncbi:MAG TPA: efflux RND transporter permease subunit [Sulfuricurvum sp.]|nr:efflux RND transporter permease subunit [Sulfuricurvum sp.]
MYKFAINRPITILMMVVSLIVFGLLSFRSMPVALFPNVDFPIVTIQTYYPGADPETVESKVTDKVEEAVSGIDGIDKLISTSYAGLSVVTVQFELTKDIEEAANDVRDKVGTLNFDGDIESPLVKKVSVSGAASIKLFVSTKTGDSIALMRFADEQIKPKLQRIQGVANVKIAGYRDREIRIFADPFLLNKYGISADELRGRIAQENIRSGGGKLISTERELILKTRADAKNIAELRGLLIRPGLRLEDVARVEDGLKDEKSYSSYNGEEGVLLEVQKISGSNDLEVIRGVKEVMPALTTLAGTAYSLQLTEDQSEKILININNVKFDLIYGSLLAVLIVFFFLRNLTATLIAALAIPTSIIGTFALIDLLGYDLNRLTLIGLTLAIGVFIDDAIVVIENISKKMEQGMEASKASYEGIKEISFSVMAISSVLLAVFIPVAFMEGIVGKFFNSFAMTVASGVIISYFVAVLFIPTLGARLLSGSETAFWHKTEPLFQKLDHTYRTFLAFLLRFKGLTLIAVLAVLLFSFSLASKVGGTFVPMEDMSEMRVLVKAPAGISLAAMKKEMEPLVQALQNDKRVKTVVLTIGYNAAHESHKAMIYAKLLPVEQRDGLETIIQSYREKFKPYSHLTISVEDVPPIDTGESNSPVQVVLTGPDLKTLETKSLELVKLLKGTRGTIDIDSDFEPGKPEVRISINRESAQRLGITATQISNAVASAYSSDSAISNLEEEGRQFDITLRFADEYRAMTDDLKKMQIQTASGALVSLDGLVNIETMSGAASINRYDRERKILITSNLDGAPLNDIVQTIDEKLPSLLKEGYRYRYTGDIERMQETAAAFGFTVGLAVILIYLILAALYESLIQPLIIMVAMPLSFTGVILSLYLSGNPFSIFVLIGIILLLGMVGKNAILVVDFANEAIKRGKNVDDALLEAGEKRLRPILMTTFAMIFAMLPLALGTGAGHESNSPMATAVIGGLISSTVLALFIVPVLYRMMYPLDAWLRRRYEKERIE